MFKRNLIHSGFVVLSLWGLSVLVLVASLGATTLEPMTGEQLTDRAGLIVVGECVDVRTEWFGRSLVTLYTVSVSDVLKGDTSSEITVAVPGGYDTAGAVPIAVTFPGAPALAPGEDLLLFLDAVADATGASSGATQAIAGGSVFGIVGFSQGAFPVVVEEGNAFVAQSRGSQKGALPLAIVKAQIEKYITQSAER